MRKISIHSLVLYILCCRFKSIHLMGKFYRDHALSKWQIQVLEISSLSFYNEFSIFCILLESFALLWFLINLCFTIIFISHFILIFLLFLLLKHFELTNLLRFCKKIWIVDPLGNRIFFFHWFFEFFHFLLMFKYCLKRQMKYRFTILKFVISIRKIQNQPIFFKWYYFVYFDMPDTIFDLSL